MQVIMNGFHGDAQSIAVGLQQGYPLSAILFGRFFDGLHNHIQSFSRCRHQSPTLEMSRTWSMQMMSFLQLSPLLTIRP